MATAVVRGGAAGGARGQAGTQPGRAPLVLTALILVAAVANLNLTVANVVLPDIGRAAYPTTLALITALWSGPPRTRAIALWSGIGGAITALGPMLAGPSAAALLVGLGVPAHSPARGGGPGHGRPLGPRARQREHRPGGPPGRRAVHDLRRGAGHHDQLRAGAGRGRAGPGHRPARAGRRGRVRAPAAPRPAPALRPARGRAADLLGGRGRRHHRVRLADGGDLRRAAVPAGRAGLLGAR